MRALVWTLGLVCMLMTLSGSVYAADNVFTNGDAEQGKIGEKPPAWRSEGNDGTSGNNDFPLVTVAGGHSGDKAIKLERPAGWSWTYIEQATPMRLRLNRLSRCVFSVWLKADRDMPHGVDLALWLLDGEGRVLKSGGRIAKRYERVDVGTSWKEFSTSIDIIPLQDERGKPVDGRIRAIVQQYAGGTLWVDDASLTIDVPTGADKERMERMQKLFEDAVPSYDSPIGKKAGIVEIPDGRLFAFAANFKRYESTDGGRTWQFLDELDVPGKTGTLSGVILMKDGTLGIWTESRIYFWRSADGGKTWSKRITLGPKGAPFHGNVMIETSGGRLILPVRDYTRPSRRIWENAGCAGTINGQRVPVAAHGHFLEMIFSWCYYSDDQGDTWKRSQGDIIIWKDDGYGGIWVCDEPNVVELSDGRIMMFVRTTLGRIYKAYSPDQGATWDYPEPTDIPASISPCSLNRIPETPYTRETGRAGDLLVVWNNVSADEIRRGFKRGRLSSAVSRDDGETWEYVRTLDTGGLAPLERMAELSPPGMTRGEHDLGELPWGMGRVCYPDVAFTDGGHNVVVRYLKSGINPPIQVTGRIQVLPLDWFYGKE